jgi:hypothetical protein
VPDNPIQADSIIEAIRAATAGERDKLAVERLAVADEKLRLAEKDKEAAAKARPSWWGEWVKPAPILAAAATLFGAFQVYQSDKNTIQTRFQEQSAALLSMANEVHTNLKGADERSVKYLPLIESDHSAIEAQKLINDQNSDRMQNVAVALADLRRSVEALRDAVQKTHEEMMISEAKHERESRLTTKGPQPETSATVGQR